MNKIMQHYIFSKAFTKFPGGRLRKHGPFSGEEFREDVLRPMLAHYDILRIDLTNANGFGSSFLDESFGEIGMELGIAESHRRLFLNCDDDPTIVEMIWEKIEKANSKK